MRRWLYRYRALSGDPVQLGKRLREELRELLVAGTASPPEPPAGDGSFRMELAGSVFGAEVTKAVWVSTGVAVTSGSRLRIPIAWHAAPVRRAFPTFEGTIELEPLSDTRAQLTIVGAYAVPAGVAGVLVDSTVLHGVAEGTADRVLEGIARAVSEPASDAPLPAATEPMRVADVMTVDPLVLADDQPLRTAALLLFHFGIGGAPVVDEGGALIGVLSEADLVEKGARPRGALKRGAAASWRRRDALTVGEACTRPARVTSADTRLRDAARELLDHDIARLVVVHDSRIAGIVTRHDILRALFRSDDAIQRAVEAVIAQDEETEVIATVEWGLVTLRGTISQLSRISGLVTAVEAVDGVSAVDAYNLEWREDDVVPLSMPMT